jgi:phasin family protein
MHNYCALQQTEIGARAEEEYRMTKTPDQKNAFENVAEPLKQVGETVKQVRDHAVERSREFNVRVIEYAEKNATEVFGAARAVASAKSLNELFEIQNNFVRDQLTRSANQMRELGELVVTANREAWQPVTDRLSAVAKRVSA